MVSVIHLVGALLLLLHASRCILQMHLQLLCHTFSVANLTPSRTSTRLPLVAPDCSPSTCTSWISLLPVNLEHVPVLARRLTDNGLERVPVLADWVRRRLTDDSFTDFACGSLLADWDCSCLTNGSLSVLLNERVLRGLTVDPLLDDFAHTPLLLADSDRVLRLTSDPLPDWFSWLTRGSLGWVALLLLTDDLDCVREDFLWPLLAESTV